MRSLRLVLCAFLIVVGCSDDPATVQPDVAVDATSDVSTDDVGTGIDTGADGSSETDTNGSDADLGPQPEVALDFPFDFLYVHTREVTLQGSSANATAVTVNGTDVESDDAFATWTATVALEVWDNDITIVATNDVGNETTKSIVVRADSYTEELRGFVYDHDMQMGWTLNKFAHVTEIDTVTGVRETIWEVPNEERTNTTLAYDNVGKKVYTSYEDTIVEIDVATRTPTPIPSPANQIRYDHFLFGNDTLYGVNDERIDSIDLTTGEPSTISSVANPVVGTGPSFSANAVFLDLDDNRILSRAFDEVYTTDLTSGDRAPLTTLPTTRTSGFNSTLNEFYQFEPATISRFPLDTETASVLATNTVGSRGSAAVSADGTTLTWSDIYSNTSDIAIGDGTIIQTSSIAFPTAEVPNSIVAPVLALDDGMWVGGQGLFRMDYETQTPTVIFATDQFIDAMSYDDDSILLLLQSGSITRVDRVSGDATELSPPIAQIRRGRSIVEDDTNFYVGRNNRVYVVNKATGELTFLEPTNGPEIATIPRLVFRNGTLYSQIQSGGMLSIDVTTGETTALVEADLPGCEQFAHLSGDLFVVYHWEDTRISVLNAATGEATGDGYDLVDPFHFVGHLFADPVRDILWIGGGTALDLQTGERVGFVR